MQFLPKFIMTVSGALLAGVNILWGGGGLVASAALSGGRFMTTQECLDTFGSSFSVSYWDGTDIVETTALYQSTAVFGTVASVAQTDYMQPGRSCLLYTFQGSVSSSPEQIQIDIQPQYSLFDIDQLHTAILTPANATYTTPYQSPQWIWMLGGQRTVFEGLSSANGEMYRTYVDNRLCIYCPVDWVSQSLTSGYSVRATFCSGSLTPVDGIYYIYIGVPYITYDAEGSNGTIGSTTSSTGDITVNIDMEETNGLLGSIGNAIVDIYDILTGNYDSDLEPYEPEAVETLPSLDYDDSLDAFGDLMDEAPNITAAAGFWFALYNRIFSVDVLFNGIILLCLALSLLSFILWK